MSSQSGETFDLTLAQDQMWLSQKLLGNNSFFNITAAYFLPGEIDGEIFTRAFNQLVSESDCYRLALCEEKGKVVQTFLPHKNIPVEIIDFRDQPDPMGAFHAWGEAYARLPIDFDNLIVKVALVYVNSSGAYWAFVTHHIVFDGWGSYLHLQRLKAIYQELASGTPSQTPPLPSMKQLLTADRAYRDSQVFQEDRQYWRAKLDLSAGSPKCYGQPSLGPASKSLRRQFSLPPEMVEQIRNLVEDAHFSGPRINITLFNIFTTAFCAYLYRVSGQRRLMVGIPFRNRHAELVKIPGLAVAVVPIQIEIDENDTFRSLHQKVVDESSETARHSRYPVSNPHNRYFNTILNFHNRPFAYDSEEHEIWFFSETETADIVLNVLNPDLETGVFELGFDLNTSTFNEETCSKIAAHFINLLRVFLDNPDQRVDEASVLSPEEKHQIIYGLNPPLYHPSGQWFGELFANQLALTPDVIAVECGADSLTYRQLDDKASQLAAYLVAKGAAPQKTVGLFIDRSMDMPLALLAIFKCGATYVPLDPTYPADRLAYMAKDAGLCLLLTRKSMLAHIPTTGVECICLDEDWVKDPSAQLLTALPVPDPSDPAYITYTSGSTGQPKGVVVPYASLAGYLEGITGFFKLHQGDRVLCFAALGFDASLEEILPAWCSGATVVMRAETVPTLAQFSQLIEEQHLTVLSLPAAYWAEWTLDLEARGAGLPEHLRMVMVYAEEPNISRFVSWLKLPDADSVRWINGYGPTETAISATVFEPTLKDHPETWARFPVGKPLPNHSAYILDNCGEPLPMGVPGEIYIGGDTALGYLHLPRESYEKFLTDPFWPGANRKMYRTGDFGRYLPDGNIEFLGRIDDQVKLYGFRIELGEIESRLCAYPNIRQVVVDLKELADGFKRLVAYLTLADQQPFDLEDLRSYLKQSLPHYMVPSEFVILDEFPVTPNGKIDRKALPDITAAVDIRQVEYAGTSIQKQVAAIWEEVIGVSPIGIDRNFFDLGGDSLLGMRLFSVIDYKMGIQLPVDELFRSPTIRALSRFIEQNPCDSDFCLVVLIREGGPGNPLFMIHGWGGGIVDYYELAKSIDTQWPIYGIQAAGRDGKEPPDETMEALTNRYYAEIKAVQPTGPYRFGGILPGWGHCL